MWNVWPLVYDDLEITLKSLSCIFGFSIMISQFEWVLTGMSTRVILRSQKMSTVDQKHFLASVITSTCLWICTIQVLTMTCHVQNSNIIRGGARLQTRSYFILKTSKWCIFSRHVKSIVTPDVYSTTMHNSALCGHNLLKNETWSAQEFDFLYTRPICRWDSCILMRAMKNASLSSFFLHGTTRRTKAATHL